MNKVYLIGRLTRDPELRYNQDNNPNARFSIAIDRNYSNQNGERETDFINIVVFGKQAENCQKYLTKGSQVAIDGRIQTGSYEKDGVRRYTTDVVAQSVQFLDTKAQRDALASNSTNDVTPNSFSDTMESTEVNKNDPFADFGSSIEINDDELPF